MKHEEVASGAKIERAYYTMFESGNRTPSVEVAKRIASVLEFDWTLFFEDQSNETTHKKHSASTA
jgi:transcriptional regulator with XRE-family HTH domain